MRSGLTFSPAGVLYGFEVFNGNLYTIDPTNARVTFVGGSGDPVSLIEDADFTPQGELYVTDWGGMILRVDPANGARKLVGNTGMGSGLLGLLGMLGKPCDPCDTNCDGSVNAFDIEPFIKILDGAQRCSPCAGDTDKDGTVNAFDIEPFIKCLG